MTFAKTPWTREPAAGALHWLAGGLLLVAGLGGPAAATPDPAEAGGRLSLSAGAPGQAVAGEAREQRLLELLGQAELVLEPGLVESGARREPAALADRREAADLPLFRIYDARTFLFGDADFDGFHYRFSVSFDADVDHGSASVYARLYLSHAGGPWNHYFTSEVFDIAGDSDADDYEVVTGLVDGYPSGYYDVLVELYQPGGLFPVAVIGPLDDPALRALPLEADFQDSPGFDDHHHHGVAGLAGLLPVLLLVALVRRRAWTG